MVTGQSAAADPTENTSEESNIGERIRQARENQGWSTEEMARRMGVTQETVQDWESGERDPRSNRIVILAGVLGVSAHWLLDGSSEFAPEDDGDPTEAVRAQLKSVRLRLHQLRQLVDDIDSQLDML